MKTIKGNIIHAKEDLVIHGCNCFCTMNSGVAKSIRERWPEALTADKRSEKGDINKLGTYTMVKVSPLKYVVNAYTQFNFGRDKVYLDYEALERVLEKINLGFYYGLSVALPRIGCGLAGGDWEKVKPIIEKTLGSRDITIYEL
jgi:O-acetyl-ADP-ribose deacetylase (regulator of RNase III)